MKEKPKYGELNEKVQVLQMRVSELEHLLDQNRERTERMKTRFLSAVTHELRTPMNAILGFSNLMIDKNLPFNKKEEYVEHITNNSNSLLCIVDTMIDLSLLELDELKLRKEETDLHKVLHQVYSYFNIDKYKMGKDHIAILLNKELRGKDFIIYTDSKRLQQVLSSLLHNALKFTSKGIIEFGYRVLTGKGKLQFFVKDSGKGILFEKAQSIFDKFEKLEEENGKNEGGLALGLTLAKGLVELLGGEMWLETNVFNGTTFYFTVDYLPEEKDTNPANLKLQGILV